MEYSIDPSFSNLPPLNLQLPIFDKTAAVSSDGVDLANDFDLDEEGRVRAGRFVFTKLTPYDEFTFPRTRFLENGVMYYFKNYKARDGCVSPPLNTHSVYPSEVMTRPSILQVFILANTSTCICVYSSHSCTCASAARVPACMLCTCGLLAMEIVACLC